MTGTDNHIITMESSQEAGTFSDAMKQSFAKILHEIQALKNGYDLMGWAEVIKENGKRTYYTYGAHQKYIRI